RSTRRSTDALVAWSSSSVPRSVNAAFPTDIISRCFTTELVIDETGVGRAVGDIFNEAGLKPIKVTITAGNEEAQNGFARFTVPKQILVSTLDAMMHTGELRIAKELRETPAL
ncbi:MAG: hypothetical protein WBY67_22220, partial [Pseudolabrys sp.]